MTKIPILLVDDDRELLEVYEKIFRLKGFQVLSCDNSEAALTILQEHNVSVVISDIIMPRMDGMELLHAIKRIRPAVEVIMLTG